MNKKTKNNGGFKDYKVFPRIWDPPPQHQHRLQTYIPPFVDKLFELKIIWGVGGVGGHKTFSSTLEGVMKIMTKNIQKKGVERAKKKHSEGGQTIFCSYNLGHRSLF